MAIADESAAETTQPACSKETSAATHVPNEDRARIKTTTSEGSLMNHAFPAYTLMDRMGMELLELSAEQCVIRMPVDGNQQRAGFLHGGASAALVETAGSFAAYEHAQTLNSDTPLAAVGAELNIYHLRPVSSGFVTAYATAVKLGKTRCVHAVEVKDEGGKIISTALIANQIVPASNPATSS